MLDKNKTGIALGCFVAFAHFVWALLVGLNLAQPWMSWVLGLHFLDNPFNFRPFDLVTAVLLIIVTGIVGYVMGWVFAYVWNWTHKK
jgi:hypothetical protein